MWPTSTRSSKRETRFWGEDRHLIVNEISEGGYFGARVIRAETILLEVTTAQDLTTAEAD